MLLRTRVQRLARTVRLDNDSMTIEDIAIALESDEITSEEAYARLIEEEEENDLVLSTELPVVIEEMHETAEISSETRDTMISFLG